MALAPNFLNFCPRHGFEVHDGTKNECCDQGRAIPLIGHDDVNKLVDKGRQMFANDFQALANLVESESPHNLPENLVEWYGGFAQEVQPKPEEMREAAEEGEEIEGEVLEGHPLSFDQFYAEAFSEGFGMGFEKGFDYAMQITKNNK